VARRDYLIEEVRSLLTDLGDDVPDLLCQVFRWLLRQAQFELSLCLDPLSLLQQRDPQVISESRCIGVFFDKAVEDLNSAIIQSLPSVNPSQRVGDAAARVNVFETPRSIIY